MNLVDKTLFPGFRVNAPVSSDVIRQFESTTGVRLPADYVAFLMQSNGGEGFIGKGYADLWRIEEIIAKNQSYKACDFVPGLLLFGSDGGGEAFAFDNRSEQQPIVAVPFVPLSTEAARSLAARFGEFLEGMLNS